MNTQSPLDRLDIGLFPESNYLDPKKEPCKWLGAVLIDLLEQETAPPFSENCSLCYYTKSTIKL